METGNSIRLQKYLSEAGIASRRKAEEMILSGLVEVNGRTVTEMGVKIRPGIDRVSVLGKPVDIEGKKIYILLNKPVGVVTTSSDQFGRPTVLDLIDGVKERIYPVGRLDYSTSGLLLLTNDGDFTFALTHPSHMIEKTYLATVEGIPSENELDLLRKGIHIEDYVTAPARVKNHGTAGRNADGSKPLSVLEITIHEGRNRQVRKMCEAIGHPVVALKRIRVGNLELGNLKPGEWRFLTKKEVDTLKSLC